MTNVAVCSLFPLYTTLVTYNQWTNWEKPADQNWFDPLCLGRVDELDPGDQVWLDDETLHQEGKVYGRVLVAITDRKGDIGGTNGLWIKHSIGSCRFKIGDVGQKLARLTNERAVRWWCDQHPLAYNPGYHHSEFIDPRKEFPI